MTSGTALLRASVAAMSRPTFQILVAEPGEVQRQLVDMLLSDTSLELTLVGTGREALEHLKEHTPDLCLLALDLPDVSGDVIGGKIRRVSRLARTPVVLISPQAGRFGLSDEARSRARRSGADLVLPRPLGDKNLRERIHSLLDAREETPDREGFSSRIIDDALEEIDEIPDGVALGRPGTTHDSEEAEMSGDESSDTEDDADAPASEPQAEDAQANESEAHVRRHARTEAAEHDWASGVTRETGTNDRSESASADADSSPGRETGGSTDESSELAQVRKDREILNVENAQLRRKLKEKNDQLEQGVNQKLEKKINELERRNAALLEEIEKLKSERGGGGLFGRRS